jgi:hypothetical protein
MERLTQERTQPAEKKTVARLDHIEDGIQEK